MIYLITIFIILFYIFLVDKGKALQRVNEECGWEYISNQHNFPGTSDDDDGEDYPFNPHFKPLDTNDSL